MTRTTIPVLAVSAALLLTPGAAQATCGVPSAKADFENAEVQVFSHGDDLSASHYACLRATGKRRLYGSDSSGEGSSKTILLGVSGRWLWSQGQDYDPDSDATSIRDYLLDLRTGKQVSVSAVESLALPGALVATDNGVVARFTDGRKVQLSTDQTAAGLAVRGSRVYWRTGDVAHTALLDLPKGDPMRTGPKATTIGRCKPRKGARLLLWSARAKLVLTTQGGKTWACRARTTRAVGTVTDLQVVSDRKLAYVRDGMVGTFDTATGKRSEVAGTAYAATADRLLVIAADGLHSPVDQLAATPATEPALAGNVAYWLDGAGAPQMKLLG
ncbi:hypothetical protein [Solirubrobacter soli]|uniref:hypothetical protein n=1 Tax=Solirubrobacter soli TaxID=363832 RepID=UPI00040EBEF5|nr:hypothetical protein [Solirubrobacter soli]